MVQLASIRNKDRVLTVLAVVTLHAILFYAIHRARLQEREQSAGSDRPLLLVSVRERVSQEPVARARDERNRKPLEKHRQSIPSVPSEPSNSSSIDETPGRVDWRASAARSAQAVVERGTERSYRSFDPKKEEEPEEPTVPSLFRSDEPKHKRGDVGEDVGGDPVVWMNDSCYTTLDKRVQTARDWVKAGPGQFAAPEIVCLPWRFGHREPDGTLFEHIKKREEPPVPKPGTEMNALPERVEEGGVFER